MEAEVLDFLNKKIRAEHGNRVTMDDDWIDTDVDSFGTATVFMEMDIAYGGFTKEWFIQTNFITLTIREIVEKAIYESSKS